jgi:uncharacterized membrane protein
MISPAVFWPSALGSAFFVAGCWLHRRELRFPAAIGPVFIAAPLAAFAGEHFTAARSIAGLVPEWMPARLFIAYFVGMAEVAAALSLVGRRCTRWSTILLAMMFGMFVLLMDLPAAVENPANRIYWILAVRQTTFAIGALALFSIEIRHRWPRSSHRLAAVSRSWAGMAILFYGSEHLLHPEGSPGVPSPKLTASWVPLPRLASYLTGILLVVFGAGMLVRNHVRFAGTLAGLLMLLLTIVLYVPEFFLASSDSESVVAINFIFDTLLFSGTLLSVALAQRGFSTAAAEQR